MLSAKRCGSTAVFRMFQKHPDVGVCHVNQEIENWEPNFWNLAALAIDGYPLKFINRFTESHPFLKIPEIFTEDSVFEMWNSIIETLGPVVFDKSPQYLGNKKALELIYEYRNRGNDVRIFAFIRDPRDAITSQYELWNSCVENDSLEKREVHWLSKYTHLEELQTTYGHIPVFRYEDFSSVPNCYATMIYEYCGISSLRETYDHIKPTSIGRYSASLNRKIRRWCFSVEFVKHLSKYGYKTPQMNLIDRNLIRIKKAINRCSRMLPLYT